jgi:hypothetical protein
MAVIEALATSYLEADAASVTFSVIPATYEHLQIRVSGRHAHSGSGGRNINLRFNGDTGANYSTHYMYAYNGNNKAANKYAGQTYVYGGGRLTGPYTPSRSNFAATTIDILDYANANKNTTMTQTYGIVDDYQNGFQLGTGSALWVDTAAITSILLYPDGGSDFVRGTEITLYGLNSA